MLLRYTACKQFSNFTSLAPRGSSPWTLTMPLRAKITNPGMRGFSSDASRIDSRADDPPDDVTFSSKFGLRTISLNRPKKLNSLNGSMIRKILPRLREWASSDMANVVVIKGEGRAFCAGGDVAVLAQDCATGQEGQERSKDYFAQEYLLDHYIATYPKPYVAFMNGITMGGGVGLSAHAPFRIATENTVFAMPETTIGFFPDVGASFFLSRMTDGLGMYLALTSEQLKGPQVYTAGIASHYLHSSSLPDLEARLAELQFKDYTPMAQRIKVIDQTIEEFSTGLPHDVDNHLNVDIQWAIELIFGNGNDMTKILHGLKEVGRLSQAEHLRRWAASTFKIIHERSPLSVAVTWCLLQHGRKWNIAEAFQHEHYIASKFMEHPDFVTGVSAKLIKKTKGRPSWSINKLEDVTQEDIGNFFYEGEGPPTNLNLINKDPKAEYMQYPYRASVGLPSDEDIRAELSEAIEGKQLTQDVIKDVLDDSVRAYAGRTGIREKFAHILELMQLEMREGPFDLSEWEELRQEVEGLEEEVQRAESAGLEDEVPPEEVQRAQPAVSETEQPADGQEKKSSPKGDE